MIALGVEIIFSTIGLTIIYYFIYIKLLSRLKGANNFLNTPYPGNKLSRIALLFFALGFAESSILSIMVNLTWTELVLLSAPFYVLLAETSIIIAMVIGAMVMRIRIHVIRSII